MSSRLDLAVRDALAVAAPPVPLAAIRERERGMNVRSRNRRGALAAIALLLSFAGIAAVSSVHSPGTNAHAPAPIASLRPLPTIT